MPDKEDKKKDQEDWINLVHGGTCCAFDDPQKDEKKEFVDKIKKERES